MSRSEKIIRASIVGIAGNLFLSAFKFIVGTAAHSVAITADAVNSLTGALLALLSLLGIVLAGKQADRKHPFGYGRVEYLMAFAIEGLILYIGIHELLEVVEWIREPEAGEYTALPLMLVGVALVVRIVMGVYLEKKAHHLESSSLGIVGHDALDGSVTSAFTLIAAAVYMLAGVPIEGYAGILVALMIIRTGVMALKDTIGTVLGERVSVELAARVKASILSFPEVDDVFDLVIHNYGKEKLVGSARIEVPDVLRASWIDNLQRNIARTVREETGVEMLGLTIYAVNYKDAEAMSVRGDIERLTEEYEDILNIHGFYKDEVDKEIKFNLTIRFGSDPKAMEEIFRGRVEELYPGYLVTIKTEYDLSE